MDAVLTMPVIAGITVVAGLGLIVGWRTYQRCPHCGRFVRRAHRLDRGWKRCPGCGRQYRHGVRLR